ncbi:hypothetical protein Lal_00008542 [Lupinus albus]|nr:hypothetical protein Lal_00008542 [Lupinus albus]
MLPPVKKRGATRGLPRRSPILSVNATSREKRGATRGLPRRSPILVLLSPKHAYCGVLMGSGALVLYYSRPSTLNCGVLMGSGALVLTTSVSSTPKVQKTIFNISSPLMLPPVKKRGATRGLPRRSPILVLLSPKHA